MRTITPENFYQILYEKKRGQDYLRLIKEARNQTLDEETLVEIHHIHPRSLGGDDSPANKVQLSIYQHCLAHLYLAMCFTVSEAFLPLNLMSGHQYRNLTELERITLEEVYKWSEARGQLAQKLRGKICVICKPETGEIRRVLKESVTDWLELGYRLGVPEDRQQINRTINVGRVHISDEISGTNRMVKLEDLQDWVDRGWTLGRSKECLSELKGKIPIFNPETDEEKHVQPEDLQRWLEQGWKKGTSLRMRENHGRSMKGKIRVHRGEKSIMVPKEKLQEYLDSGWERGRADWYKTKVTGKRVIFKGQEVRKVTKEEAERLVQEEGWKYGWPEGHISRTVKPGDRLWIHRGEETLKIWTSDLDRYLADGWEKGTGKAKSPETRAKFSQIRKNRLTLRKGGVTRRVDLEEAKKLLEEGWELRGRKNNYLLETED